MTISTWVITNEVEINTATYISNTQIGCTLPDPDTGYIINIGAKINTDIEWSINITVLNFDIRCRTCTKDGNCVKKVSEALNTFN